MMRDLVLKNRSYRRFYQEHRIESGMLREFVDLARLSASAGNLQPLKYILACDPELNAIIFPHLTWARYLKDWAGPPEGERPAAYIIILGDTNISQSFYYDCGIAAQTVLLGATERGLGGCMIASINKDALRQSLMIASHLEILLVIALGKPKETVVVETMNDEGGFRYWRDSSGVHHVPKRRLDDIIVRNCLRSSA